MISFLADSLLNSPLSETVRIYWNNIITTITGAPVLFAENQTVLTFVDSLPVSLKFDEFQSKLLKGFLLILFINILIICTTWKIYGKRICDRFMKPATSTAIEELKASVSKLKLPKEHTPRI